MFSTAQTTTIFNKNNKTVEKKINLDKNLDCFILISSNDENLIELSLNKILDSIINKIWIQNTYTDFSNSLEIINSFLKTWMKNNEKMYNLDIIIWVLNKNNFIFSNIWSSSCYLVKNNNDIIEITEKHDNKKFFDFVSSWELNNNEIILLWTKRILNYISKSDLLDWKTYKDTESFIKNIKNILTSEILNENIWLITIKYGNEVQQIKKQNLLIFIRNYFIKFSDNTFIKKIIAFYMIFIEKYSYKSKKIKNIIFFTWWIISFIILYIIISWLVWVSNNISEKDLSKENLLKARNFIRLASENITNSEVFELNINASNELIKKIKDKNLFLNDIKKINDDINIIKKQFNKVETFNINDNNTFYKWDLDSSVKIVKLKWKFFIILNKWIIWPIIPWKTPKIKLFNKLENRENFIDATIFWTNIYLLTSLSNIVSYSKIWQFKFIDVQSQNKWEKAKSIDSYNSNIYLVGKDNNQIYKHKKIWNKFLKWSPYIKETDTKELKWINSIWIDWWIYILKKDLSIIKLFKSPTYKIDNIMINSLPNNYVKNNSNSRIEIKTSPNLNYFYILMNNKIWIMKPNTKRFQDTKSLTYISQIEWDNEQIIDFFVDYDWEITLLTKKSISKLKFEITKNKLILK